MEDTVTLTIRPVEVTYPCVVKSTRTHNTPCRCEVVGSLHNRGWQIEQEKK